MEETAMKGTEFLTALAALLVALSVASERLVEILKGFVPFLNRENADPRKEGWRRSLLQALAVISGVVTALLARPAVKEMLPDPWDHTRTFLALGLLTSGGSGLWNGVLSYVKNVKDIKKLQAKTLEGEC